MTVVLLNGRRQELPDGATVEAAVRALGVEEEGRGVAVAVDGAVVPRRQWADTALDEDQQVEVLRAVQGG
jgi:sulfur carrier protein